MRKLIQSVPTAEAAYLAGDDAAVIVEMNNPTQEKKFVSETEIADGQVSNVSMGKDLGENEVGEFLVALEKATLASQAAGEPGFSQYTKLKSFSITFSTLGLNFTDPNIRAQIEGILVSDGKDPVPYLALGFTLESVAMKSKGMVFALEHVNEARRQEAVINVGAKTQAMRVAAGIAANEFKTPAEIDAAALAAWS